LVLAEAHFTECHPVDIGAALVAAVQTRPAPSPAEFRRTRVIFDKLLGADPSNPQLVFYRANLAQVEGAYPEAERLYRNVLVLDPEHVLAANNLAYSMALRGGELSESLQRINRAIELAGPLPTLLDTRAVVYTRMGRSDDAIPELEKILAETKAGSAGFH